MLFNAPPLIHLIFSFTRQSCLLQVSTTLFEDLSSAQQRGQAGYSGKLMPWKQLNQRWEGNLMVNRILRSQLGWWGISVKSSGSSHQDWLPMAGNGNCPDNELLLASFLSLKITSPTRYLCLKSCLGNPNQDCSTTNVPKLISYGLKVECKNT